MSNNSTQIPETLWVSDCFDVDSVDFDFDFPPAHTGIVASTNQSAKKNEFKGDATQLAQTENVEIEKPILNLILPRIPISTTENEIISLFQLWDIGKINEIRFVHHSQNFKKAYIFMASWFKFIENIELIKELQQGRSIKKYHKIHPGSQYYLKPLAELYSDDSDYEEDEEEDEEYNVSPEYYWIIQPNMQKKGGRKTKINVDDINNTGTTLSFYVEQSFDYIHIDYIEHLIRVNIELKNDILALNETLCSFEININEVFYSFHHNIQEYQSIADKDGLIHESNTLYGIEYENMFLYNKKQEFNRQNILCRGGGGDSNK